MASTRALGRDGLTSRRPVQWAPWLVLGALGVSEAAHDLGVIASGGTLFDGWIHTILIVGAAALCLVYAAEAGRNRPASLAFGAGLASWAAGEVWWMAFYENDADPPFPSVSDALWLGWYPLTALGLALLIRHGIARFHLHRWMDGVGAMLIAITPLAALFLAPAADAESSHGALASIVVLSYPVLDALLIGAVLGVYGLLDWRIDRAWLLLGLGCVLVSMGDGLFAVQEARSGAIEADYNFTWSLGALLIALAVRLAVDVPPEHSESVGWRAIALPLGAQALAAAIQIYGFFEELGNTERLVTLFVLLVAMVQIIVSRPRAPTDAAEADGARAPGEGSTQTRAGTKQ